MEKVINQNPDRKYFTQICNIIDELDLSALAIALYFHYKRFADTGRTDHPGVGFLTKKYRCGSRAIADAKDELEDAGLVKVTRFPKREGRPDEVEILDIWERNVKHFQSDSIPVVNERQVANLSLDNDSPLVNERQPSRQPATDLSLISDSLKDKEFKDFKNLNIGGGSTSTSRENEPPTAGSDPPGNVQKESIDDFLIRMQTTFNNLNVPSAFSEFKRFYLNTDQSLVASLDNLRVDFRKFLGQKEIVRVKKIEYADSGHDIEAIWNDFVEKCGSDRYPKMRPTKERFDQWMRDQYEDLNIATATGAGSAYVNPMTGRSFK